MTRPAIRPELPSGTIIADEFEVVERLAGGGMGEVYVARQRSTGALRAIKRLHAHLLTDEVSRTRFEREAKVVAKIESQHVAQVIAAGIDRARGEPFIAMEYLRGPTVSKLLASGPMGRDDAVRVMMGVGHALAAAHRVGVVHRDLKPDNVMLVDSQLAGISSIVKVLDFGIALVAKGTLSARITGDLSVGTPPYMAPEQFSDSSRIGPHTDVWAMGLLLFEMLTGQRFWQSDAKQGGTLATLIQEIVEQPIAASALRAREKNAIIDPPLAAWIDLCLQREPSRRFDDAQRALDALTQSAVATAAPLGAAPPVQSVYPTSTHAPSSSTSTAHSAWPTQGAPMAAPLTVATQPASLRAYVAPTRDNTARIVVAGALAALLSVGAIVTIFALRPADAQRDDAVSPPSNVAAPIAMPPRVAPVAPVPPAPLRRPPIDLSAQEREPASPPSLAPRPRAVQTRPTPAASGLSPPASERRGVAASFGVAERDARLRAVVFRAIRDAHCFDERSISTVRGSVMLVVHEDGHILSASTDSNYWACLVRARLTSLSGPRWGGLYRASFPLDELYR